ncbi:MAG: type 4a pilus biogenesis protein PilO [Neisseria sp.]|uniref:type 4a pilus biogenesis protein PilO n=1 Tax=Neisseria sp. TaxID=192066 RepID=UPI0026DD8835|nr:type 4a pilus biogenesis protein PilO [Neisseria sp.]MDO4640905.1 type 4a pilus biogenesis protein PilO [Neisseria sp.]
MADKKLKDVDLQTLHLLGKPAKLAIAALVVVAVLGAGYFAIFRTQLEELAASKQKEEELKVSYTEKSIQAASLDNLKSELAAIRTSFDVLLRQLPTDAEIPNLVQELHQAGATNGMNMNSVTPQATTNDGPIQILPYAISITGKYDQISQFTRDVGALSRIITLESINLSKDEKDDGLTLTATANTYKARPAEEVLAEQKAASAANGSEQQNDADAAPAAQ